MLVIFIMSAQPASESSQLSGGIVSKIIAAFLRNFDSLSSEKQLEITGIITTIVRKTAHFLEYFILGLLAYCTELTYKRHRYKIKATISVVFCVVFAVSDEIHQFFVPGRACRFADICIDTAGSLLAIALISIIIYFKKRHRLGVLNA